MIVIEYLVPQCRGLLALRSRGAASSAPGETHIVEREQAVARQYIPSETTDDQHYNASTKVEARVMFVSMQYARLETANG